MQTSATKYKPLQEEYIYIYVIVVKCWHKLLLLWLNMLIVKSGHEKDPGAMYM
jgi:hypothetical protein